MSATSKARAKFLARTVGGKMPGRGKVVAWKHYRSVVLVNKRERESSASILGRAVDSLNAGR